MLESVGDEREAHRQHVCPVCEEPDDPSAAARERLVACTPTAAWNAVRVQRERAPWRTDVRP
jgi:hypothetical protein